MLHQLLVERFLCESILLVGIFEQMIYNLLDSVEFAPIFAIFVFFVDNNGTDFWTVLGRFFLQLFLFKLLSLRYGISDLFLSLSCLFKVFFCQFIRCYLNTLSKFIFFIIFQGRFLRHKLPAFRIFLDRLIWFTGSLFAEQLIFILFKEYILFFFVRIGALFGTARKEFA